jgi:hypothetical protein
MAWHKPQIPIQTNWQSLLQVLRCLGFSLQVEAMDAA